MIVKLDKTDYKNVLQLLSQGKDMIDTKAVLVGNNPGFVLADSTSSPKSALIWTKNGSILIGDRKNEGFNKSLKDAIKKYILPLHKELGYNGLDILGTSHEWDKTIEEVFQHKGVDKSNQRIYGYLNLDHTELESISLDEGYRLRVIDRQLLKEGYKNIDGIINEILVFWDSMDNFFQKGFGHCVTKDDLIVSRCTIDYIYENQRSLGVSTHKDYRKKGLARGAAIELLKHCKEKAYQVFWDCTETNTASVALAESLGFTKIDSYTVYYIPPEAIE